MGAMDLIREDNGKLSTSDAFLYFFTGILFVCWLGLGVAIFLGHIEWTSYSNWFRDGVNFVYVSVIPYIANKFANRISMSKGSSYMTSTITEEHGEHLNPS